ncbi:hypothetical protein AKJ50_01990 [candidate division MSBL1 archaeon SCGC-AAA382A13]|uniref:Transcription regulator AsnC/Lrp ligand binding domain-containing protein n=1 Tax=candidate division MSBL1 archaeon SCGC-AAA382A13 TaxID=1698279 RepID=A0A133VEG3_9EURY|nr:hypothetical protein AKJ50_01990 [candidate division MSBL1 archaeon SCGC-AAA382A13]
MIRAFILIKAQTEGGQSGIKTVVEEVKSLQSVVETHRILGPFDVLIKTETETMDELTDLIDTIRNIYGAKETATYLTH